jgi:Bacterial TSP3 repeat
MNQTGTRRPVRARIGRAVGTMLVVAAAVPVLIPATSSASVTDLDNDGLSNIEEVANGTRPLVADTDGDGLKDGPEVKTYKTNPKVKDTDGDGLTDGAEVNTYKTNPKAKDTDGDGLTDNDEVNFYKTNPNLKDGDGDGFSDPDELFDPVNPSNPNDRTSVPYKGTRPQARIDSVVQAGTKLTVTFSSPNDPTATFQCQNAFATIAWTPCTSPTVFTLASADAAWTINVRAIDADGDIGVAVGRTNFNL